MGNGHAKKAPKLRSPRSGTILRSAKVLITGSDAIGAFHLFRQHRFRYAAPPSQEALTSYRLQALELASAALEAVCAEVSTSQQAPAVPESLRGLVRDYANGEVKEKFSCGKFSPDVLYQVNTVWNGLKQSKDFQHIDAFRLGYFWMEHLIELLEMSSATDRLVGELGRLPPTPLPVEPSTWSTSFETAEMRLDPSSPSLLMICGGSLTPQTVLTKLHEMGESHVDYVFWVFDAALYCVPCADDPTQMRLAKDIEDFHAFVRDNLSPDDGDSQVTVTAIFSNRKKACELLTKTSIRVCFPEIDIAETNTNNGMDVLRTAMNHAIPDRRIHKSIIDGEDFSTQKIVSKVTSAKKS